MENIQMKQILQIFSRPSTRNLVQRRIIYLATKRIIEPDEQHEAAGPGTVRRYSHEKVVEIGIALKLMEISMGTEKIRFILNEWRKNMEETDGVCGCLGEYLVFIPKSVDEGPPENDTVIVDEDETLRSILVQKPGTCYLHVDIGQILFRVDTVNHHWGKAHSDAAKLSKEEDQ